MSGRSSSARLRSALSKMIEPDDTVYNSSTVTMTSEKASRSSRRTNGHHGMMNGGFNNGNGGSTSTRSQSRTRGIGTGGGSGGGGFGVPTMTIMDVDVEENNTGVTSSVTADSITSINDSGVNSDCKSSNSGSGSVSEPNNGNNSSNCKISLPGNTAVSSGTSTNENEATVDMPKSANCSSTAGADSNSMEVDDSSSESTSSDSSDSSDSEDSSEMDEHNSEIRKQEFQTDLMDLEKQFQYLRELLYHERVSQITAKLEEVRSGKAAEYLGPLAQLQENMRIRMEVTASLRQFRLVNLQHKFDAETLAIQQNFDSEKQLLYDSIKSDLEEKIRRLEEDRNNDFTSELWLETALKRKNKKSIDLFGDKKKKPVTVSGPFLVYMLNDVDIVEDWTVIKKALAAPKRKHVDLVY